MDHRGDDRLGHRFCDGADYVVFLLLILYVIEADGEQEINDF